ncbi:1-acyl-sn-glycerol-3-phosphate acyltransferase, partial [Halobellus sp. Atlit-31R]
MNVRLALRLARVTVHLLAGLATGALVFPLASIATRERLTRRWSRKLLGLCRVSVEQTPGAQVAEHALIVANHVS